MTGLIIYSYNTNILICSGIISILLLFKIFLIRKYGVGDENMDAPSVSRVLLREKGQDQQQIVQGCWQVLSPTRKKTSYSDRRFWYSYILFIIIIGGILVLFMYITRLASNEIFSPSNKIHWEVGRAKDLSAPRYVPAKLI